MIVINPIVENSRIGIKELLDAKNERELDKMRARKRGDGFLSIMEDFHSIILFGEFSEVEVREMLRRCDLLEQLAVFWQDDERVMELQEMLLGEFLRRERKADKRPKSQRCSALSPPRAASRETQA